MCFLGGTVVKNALANTGNSRDMGSIPGLGKKKWQPTRVFSSGKFHGQRSLVVYIPHGVTKGRTRLSSHDTFMKLILCAG